MDFRDIMSTVSVLEIIGFLLNMVFFLTGGKAQLGFAVMNMFHVLRGFLGFILSRIFPASHDIISKLDYSGSKQLNFSQFPLGLSSTDIQGT